MKKLILILIITASASLAGMETNKKDIIHCEPSLLFSDMFFFEDQRCFSYSEVSDAASDSEQLKDYLDTHSDDSHQHYFRLSYYLRERNFFSALITFIHMVNTGAADPSVMIYEKEFSNIIAGGIKHAKDIKTGKAYGQKIPGDLMSMDEFSTNFFAVVSYLASQDKTPPGSKEDTDLKILALSFQYTFSNFFNGIDLEKDNYSRDLFNRLIRLKNAEMIRKYLQFFFYFSKKGGAAPEYRDYLSLKSLDAVKGFDMHVGNRIDSQRMKQIFASFYLDNMEKMPQIEYSDSFSRSELLNADKKTCDYLLKREHWLKNIEIKDPEDIRYNESIRIVENCPGSFSLPFVILNDRIVIEKNYSWMTDIAVALKYIERNEVKPEFVQSILNGAVRASLGKTSGSRSSKFADLLYFFYYTDRSSDLLLALYSKQIGNIKKDVPDPENWAADFLSSSLF